MSGLKEDEKEASASTELNNIINGFKINWMQMRDGESGNVLWQTDSWDNSLLERDEHFPKELLQCRSVYRQINFSSVEKIQDFEIRQKVYLGPMMIEEWNFHFGFVMPNSTNTWEQIIDAAEPDEMLTPDQLNGNMKIETLFYDGSEQIYRSVMRVFYE